MNEILHEAFRYSAWATKTLIAACRELSIEQLERPARGFGSILATLSHVVQSDAGYVATVTGASPAWATDGDAIDDLDRIEARVDETARLWERFLAGPVDAERRLSLDEGEYECHVSVVVTQALHHANAHREQIRAGLGDLGVRPPDVQPWEYALATGRAHWRRDSRRRHAASDRTARRKRLFRLSGAVRRDPAVDAWMRAHSDELGAIARHWFDVVRARGDDVREILHDGHPTACVADAAFAYVDAFTAHVNVGFFRGAELPDPTRLLEGTGELMRHVKLRPEHEVDAAALVDLVDAAYDDMKRRVEGE